VLLAVNFHDAETHTVPILVINMKIQNRAVKNARADRQTRPAIARTETVQSLSRALTLLKTLAKNDHGLGLSELAHQVKLPVSTAHRLLSTLQHENFVRYDAQRGVWLVGVQAFVVGCAFLRSRELTAIARPLMQELMERSGETVNLAVEEGGEVVYMAQAECRQTMRAIARPGGRAAMHASALGKALLAAMPEAEVKRIIAQRGLPAITEKTITAAEALRAELKLIRTRHFAIDDEENAPGLRCVAAAIFDEHARPVAAVSLSGPSVRITPELLPGLGESVRQTAAQITLRLGGRCPAH
jgi:IclR family acetate operon transcriptional repressor